MREGLLPLYLSAEDARLLSSCNVRPGLNDQEYLIAELRVVVVVGRFW